MLSIATVFYVMLSIAIYELEGVLVEIYIYKDGYRLSDSLLFLTFDKVVFMCYTLPKSLSSPPAALLIQAQGRRHDMALPLPPPRLLIMSLLLRVLGDEGVDAARPSWAERSASRN